MGAQIANPMAEYLLKLQLIVRNTEFKDKEEADKYETAETKMNGEAYVNAVLKTDAFESYQYDGRDVYKLLAERGYDEDRIFVMMKNPLMIPLDVRDILLENARAAFIKTYVEPNKYYMNLTGKPFKGNDEYPADPVILIPDEFYERYRSDSTIRKSEPIHELPLKYQELFVNSEFYSPLLFRFPNVKYLRYLGTSAIPIEVSRKARDGDIMKINTNRLSTYHHIFGNVSVDASIVHAFSNIYKSTRDYVYNTLRGDFSNIYENYNSLIRYLTIYMAIGASMNEFQRKSTKLIYMNNVTANNLFMLYGLPSVIMEGTPMIEFLKKFRLLLMDKGTNVVYRVKDLIGYADTDIYTLVMVKQQKFENGIPIYKYLEDGTKVPVSRIVFRRMGTTADETSYFKFRESKKEYTWQEITDGDPRWWGYNGNDATTEEILSEMNYTLSNSKYIQLSTHMSMSDIWWQCVIFIRGMLDRRQETSTTLININHDINGSSSMSLFDAVLTLTVMMHWQLTDFKNDSMSGNMYIPDFGKYQCIDKLFDGLYIDGSPRPLKDGGPFKLASFNFDVRKTDYDGYMALYDYDYLNPEYFMPMLNGILDMSDSNTGEVLLKDVKLLYKYLEDKLVSCRTIHQFRQVTETYKLLFLVDPIRDWYDNSNVNVDELLCEKYEISQIELDQFKQFYPPEGSLDPNKVDDQGNPKQVSPDFTIHYKDKDYNIFLYNILNEYTYDMELNDEYIFRDSDFVKLFNTQVLTGENARDKDIPKSTLSAVIKDNYRRIIVDKVAIDLGSSDYGPTTFENLLMMDNPKLYEYLVQQKTTDGDNIITLLRSIIKALEAYTNSSLAGLEFKALGADEYFRILKEVITYFKSYMVEFTKDEFIYIFGGLLDNGGNSDMLKLIDEINQDAIEISPHDSFSLYDVSHAKTYYAMDDDNIGMLYDDVLFRVKSTYADIKSVGYDIWYDNGKRITKTQTFSIDDDTEVIANIVHDGNSYKIIINIENVDDGYPPGYYGNAL